MGFEVVRPRKYRCGSGWAGKNIYACQVNGGKKGEMTFLTTTEWT